jgi:hypothetical protein
MTTHKTDEYKKVYKIGRFRYINLKHINNLAGDVTIEQKDGYYVVNNLQNIDENNYLNLPFIEDSSNLIKSYITKDFIGKRLRLPIIFDDIDEFYLEYSSCNIKLTPADNLTHSSNNFNKNIFNEYYTQILHKAC